jgi:hypothetical protein
MIHKISWTISNIKYSLSACTLGSKSPPEKSVNNISVVVTMKLTGLLGFQTFVGNYAAHKDKQHWDMGIAR